MPKYLLFIVFICYTSQIKAQKYGKSFEIESYKHTITYQDHKVVLHAQSTDKVLKSVDPIKKYYWYSNNQIKITQGGFSGKLLDGLYTDFYLNNNLKEQGQFKLGLRTGVWRSWSEQGVLLAQTIFKKGLPDGTFYKYNESGAVVETGNYKKGILSQPVSKSSWLKRLFASKPANN